MVDSRAAAGGRTTVPMVIFNRFDTISKYDWTLWSVGRLLANGSIHTSWVNNHGELATAMMTRMNESARAWLDVNDMQPATNTASVQGGSAFNASWTVSGGDGQLEAPFTSLRLWQTGRSGETGYLAGSCTAESAGRSSTVSCVVLRGQYLNTTGPKLQATTFRQLSKSDRARGHRHRKAHFRFCHHPLLRSSPRCGPVDRHHRARGEAESVSGRRLCVYAGSRPNISDVLQRLRSGGRGVERSVHAIDKEDRWTLRVHLHIL